MTLALTFNDITLTIITHQNSLWIRSVELARALGYSDESSVGRIYKRNEEEFTPEMTQVIEMNEAVNLTVPARIFSLRGCHLVAMFARTPVAKAFRKWVLDVLEKYAAEQTALSAAPGPDAALTPDQQCTLQAVVKGKVESIPADRRPRGLYPQIWSRFNNHFRLASYKQLPQSRLSEGIAYLMGMELPAPLPQAKASAAAPVAPKKPVAQAVGSVRIGASDLSARQDAMRRISKVQWQLAAAIDVMRLFCNPKAHPDQCGEMSLEMASNLYTTAHASLVSAYNALEAAERLQHGRI